MSGGGGEPAGLDDRLREREVAAHALGAALLEVHLRELGHAGVAEPGPVALRVEPRDHLVGGERVRADDRFTGSVQRADGTRARSSAALASATRWSTAACCACSLATQRRRARPAAARGRSCSLRSGVWVSARVVARLLELLGVVVVAARRGVAELLAARAVEHAAGEDVGGAGAVAAHRVQRDRALAEVVEQRVAELRERGALLVERGDLRLVVGDLRLRPRRGAGWWPRASPRPRARPAARPRPRRRARTTAGSESIRLSCAPAGGADTTAPVHPPARTPRARREQRATPTPAASTRLPPDLIAGSLRTGPTSCPHEPPPAPGHTGATAPAPRRPGPGSGGGERRGGRWE